MISLHAKADGVGCSGTPGPTHRSQGGDFHWNHQPQYCECQFHPANPRIAPGSDRRWQPRSVGIARSTADVPPPGSAPIFCALSPGNSRRNRKSSRVERGRPALFQFRGGFQDLQRLGNEWHLDGAHRTDAWERVVNPAMATCGKPGRSGKSGCSP